MKAWILWLWRQLWRSHTTPATWHISASQSQHGESRPLQRSWGRGLTKCKGGIRSQGTPHPPRSSRGSTPRTKISLLYYIMPFTTSSDINRGLSPHHLFLEKVNLELLDNKSPEHNKSVSIQKPLWWLSSLPDRFIRTLTATHVRGTGSLKHPRNVGASKESKSLE